VLKHLDLAIQPGEFVAIEGRSGSGKSTLLHILGALDAVDGGDVFFEGRDFTRRVRGDGGGFIAFLTGRLVERIVWACMVIVIALWIAALFPRFAKPATIAAIVVGLPWSALFIAHFGTRLVLALLSLPEERAAAELRNKHFGFVFQFYHLLPELNVLENTMLSSMIENSWLRFRLKRNALRQRAIELLDQLGLSHRLKHRPNQLSGGERQRVAIARALMNSPRVVFADEPTGNLDAETGRQIMTVLEKLHRESGQTIVMVTHDRSLARQADRVLVLKDGRLEKPAP